MTNPEIYLPDATYAALRAKLAQLIAQPDDPNIDAETQVVAALGEVGGVWPERVLDDPQRTRWSK